MEIGRKVYNFFSENFKTKKSRTAYTEFSDFFLSEKMFNLYGISNLQTDFPGTRTMWKNFVYIASLLIIVMYLLLPLTSLIVNLTQNGSLLILFENFTGISLGMMILMKSFSINYWNRAKIKDTIQTLELHYPHDGWNQYIFEIPQHLKSLRFIEEISIFSLAFSASVYTFAPFAVYIYGLITSQYFKLFSIFQLNLPIDQTDPIIYFVINFIIFNGIFYVCSLVLVTDFLYSELMAVVNMELKILGKLMSEIDPADDQVEALNSLRKLIDAHNDLIKVTENLEEIFSPLLFIDIFGMMVLMCASAFFTFVSTFMETPLN